MPVEYRFKLEFQVDLLICRESVQLDILSCKPSHNFMLILLEHIQGRTILPLVSRIGCTVRVRGICSQTKIYYPSDWYVCEQSPRTQMVQLSLLTRGDMVLSQIFLIKEKKVVHRALLGNNCNSLLY